MTRRGSRAWIYVRKGSYIGVGTKNVDSGGKHTKAEGPISQDLYAYLSYLSLVPQSPQLSLYFQATMAAETVLQAAENADYGFKNIPIM